LSNNENTSELMTLKEKFQNEKIYINPYSFKLTKEGVENFEKIADEFAIGFGAWCIKKRVDFFDDTEIGETYTIDGFVSRYKIKELLEIYKKEKGL